MGRDAGSAAATILHIAVEVMAIVTVTAVAALAAILASWAAVRIVRKRRLARRQARLPRPTVQAYDASRSSDSRGQACFAQSPKARSASEAQPIPARGSTQMKLPERPK